MGGGRSSPSTTRGRTESHIRVSDDHGHACIVRPQSAAAVGDGGPHVMSVADVNRPDPPMRTAFHAHPEAWPDRIALYARIGLISRKTRTERMPLQLARPSE